MKSAVLTLLALTTALSAADVSGKWVGTWEAVNHPRGAVTDTCFLALQQSGETITGKTGPKRDVQWDIKNAKLNGSKLTFDAVTGQLELSYELELNDSGLAGTVVARNRPGVSWKMTMKRE